MEVILNGHSGEGMLTNENYYPTVNGADSLSANGWCERVVNEGSGQLKNGQLYLRQNESLNGSITKQFSSSESHQVNVVREKKFTRSKTEEFGQSDTEEFGQSDIRSLSQSMNGHHDDMGNGNRNLKGHSNGGLVTISSTVSDDIASNGHDLFLSAADLATLEDSDVFSLSAESSDGWMNDPSTGNGGSSPERLHGGATGSRAVMACRWSVAVQTETNSAPPEVKVASQSSQTVAEVSTGCPIQSAPGVSGPVWSAHDYSLSVNLCFYQRHVTRPGAGVVNRPSHCWWTGRALAISQ